MALYINGEKIKKDEIQAEVERLRPRYEKLAEDLTDAEKQKQLHEWSRENIIEGVLLRQAAYRDTEEITPDIVEQAYQKLIAQFGSKKQLYEHLKVTENKEGQIKKDLAQRIRIDRLIHEIASKVSPPSEQEIQKYYKKNISEFTTPEMIRASHIVKHIESDSDSESLRNQMQQIVDQLRNDDADFAEIAEKHSDCPENGGDLNFFTRGQMVQKFEDVVFAMDIGQVSDVFQTEFGYHIAKITDKKPFAPRPFEEVRETIMQKLMEPLQQKAIDDFVDAEKTKAAIVEK